MANEYVMAVDMGTTAYKVIIADRKGIIMAESDKLLEPFSCPYPGWVEQDPNDWLEKLSESTKEAITKAGIASDQIEAMGVSNNGRGFIPMSEGGKNLRPAILWLDTRSPPFKTDRMKWFRENEPDHLAKTYKILGPQGWLTYTLTGNWRDSSGSAFADELQDINTWDWDEKLIQEAKIPLEMLPELVLPGEVLGYVTKSAAEKFSLPQELPVIAGCRDKQCGSLGAGAVGKDKLMLSLGTAITLGSTSDKAYFAPIYPQRSGIPFYYDSEMGFGGGFWTLRWLTEQFPSWTGVEGPERYQELEEAALMIPPGSDGLIVLPHWWGGQWFRTFYPPWERGAVLGWSGNHTVEHFYRALIEGLIHEARMYKEQMEQIMETSFTSIRIIGGGSKSDFVLQIVADIFGSKVSRIHTSSAEALGAAMVAAKGCGWYESVEEAVENMSRVVQTFEPNQKNVEIYDAFHNSVYREIHHSLDAINQNLTRLSEQARDTHRK